MSTGEMLATLGGQAALVAKQEWSDKADAWLETLISGDLFTSEDLVQAIGYPDQRFSNLNNAVGAKIRDWAHKSLSVHRGYAKSTRPVSHARIIKLWEKK